MAAANSLLMRSKMNMDLRYAGVGSHTGKVTEWTAMGINRSRRRICQRHFLPCEIRVNKTDYTAGAAAACYSPNY